MGLSDLWEKNIPENLNFEIDRKIKNEKPLRLGISKDNDIEV